MKAHEILRFIFTGKKNRALSPGYRMLFTLLNQAEEMRVMGDPVREKLRLLELKREIEKVMPPERIRKRPEASIPFIQPEPENSSTRYDDENTGVQCTTCNTFHEGEQYRTHITAT